MTEQLVGQVSLFDHAISSGKTFRAACQVQESETEKTTKEKTSKQYSQKSSRSSNQMPLMCLCLKIESGQNKDAYMEWEEMDFPFPWLTNCTMLNIGELHNEDGESAYSLTSMDTPQQKYCLTLNLSEHPREENHVLLSDILENDTNERYNLSPKACVGILNRANRRGKKLPDVLRIALEKQANL